MKEFLKKFADKLILIITLVFLLLIIVSFIAKVGADSSGIEVSDLPKGSEVEIYQMPVNIEEKNLNDSFEDFYKFSSRVFACPLDSKHLVFENSDRCPICDEPLKKDRVTDDKDGDGMSDEYEGRNGLNPQDPNDANIDSDGDGFPNIIEYNEGESEAGDASDYPSLLFTIIYKEKKEPKIPFVFFKISSTTSVQIKNRKGDSDIIGIGDSFDRIWEGKTLKFTLKEINENKAIPSASTVKLLLSIDGLDSIDVIMNYRIVHNIPNQEYYIIEQKFPNGNKYTKNIYLEKNFSLYDIDGKEVEESFVCVQELGDRIEIEDSNFVVNDKSYSRSFILNYSNSLLEDEISKLRKDIGISNQVE